MESLRFPRTTDRPHHSVCRPGPKRGGAPHRPVRGASGAPGGAVRGRAELLQAVAEHAQGRDLHLGVQVGKFLAQEGDVGLGGVLAGVALGAPDGGEEVVLGDHAARGAHEHAHDLELLLGEVHVAAVAAQVVGVEVEGQVAELHLVDGHLALAAGEGADAGEQLVGVDGLGHVVVRAAVESLDLVGGGGLGGHDDDGGGHAVATQLVHDLEAVHLGEHDVEDHDVVLAGLRELVAGLAVVCGLRVAAVLRQDVAHGVVEVLLVFDNQDVHRSSLLWTLAPGNHGAVARASCCVFNRVPII